MNCNLTKISSSPLYLKETLVMKFFTKIIPNLYIYLFRIKFHYRVPTEYDPSRFGFLKRTKSDKECIYQRRITLTNF
ncbi:hypothetical protein HanIR_Chr14g0709031 [Helianthus annuus]|nr:hypothetical protein HanIR_Chr14g0709031 [Helianthus annuus]